jgi:hypothetical protein
MPARGNNGQFIKTPKRDRSAENKAQWLELQFQKRRARQIERMVAKGYTRDDILDELGGDLREFERLKFG